MRVNRILLFLLAALLMPRILANSPAGTANCVLALEYEPHQSLCAEQALEWLRLNGCDLTIDTCEHCYYATLPSDLAFEEDYTAVVEWKSVPGVDVQTLMIDGLLPSAKNEVTLKNVTCARTYELTLFDSTHEAIASGKLQFTFLPIVEICMDSCNNETFTAGTWRVVCADDEYDKEKVKKEAAKEVAAFRWRGNLALFSPKKSYAVKLRDAAGNSVDRQYFGLRSDNNWILDAMSVDPACMRNRVGTDLWNEFAAKPYYAGLEKKALTGTRGRFVEVFLNGRYNGIYCMTEKLDRKQLKLKKYKSAEESKSGEDEVHGLIYKPNYWCYEVLMGHEPGQMIFPELPPASFSNTLGVEEWNGFEIKYPDYEEEAVEWTPLWNAVNFVATSTQSDFDGNVDKYFDMPVVDDYYLFIDLLLATDNSGKNMYYYVYDRSGAEGDKLSIAPWDLDGTFGVRWNGQSDYTEDSSQDLDAYLWSYENGQHTLFYRLLDSSAIGWKTRLARRYAELRGTVFKAENLARRFAAYGDLFAKSCADKREEQRWGEDTKHNDIAVAIDYAKNWINGRIEALDKKYGYGDGGVVDVNAAAENISVAGGKGMITVISAQAHGISLYSAQGTLVRTVWLTDGVTEIDDLAPGVYVVEKKKVMVR